MNQKIWKIACAFVISCKHLGLEWTGHTWFPLFSPGFYTMPWISIWILYDLWPMIWSVSSFGSSSSGVKACLKSSTQCGPVRLGSGFEFQAVLLSPGDMGHGHTLSRLYHCMNLGPLALLSQVDQVRIIHFTLSDNVFECFCVACVASVLLSCLVWRAFISPSAFCRSGHILSLDGVFEDGFEGGFEGDFEGGLEDLPNPWLNITMSPAWSQNSCRFRVELRKRSTGRSVEKAWGLLRFIEVWVSPWQG